MLDDELAVQRPRQGECGVRAGRRGRHEDAAVRERFELRDPVVLATRRAEEHARTAQQRAVGIGLQAPHDANAGRVELHLGTRHDQLLALAVRAPRIEHLIETLLVRVRGVRDGRDVAQPRGRTRGLDRDRDHHRIGVRLWRLRERAGIPRHEQRRGGEPATFERSLPEAMAAGAVGRGRRVVADRARSRPQQRGGDRVVEDRLRLVLGDAGDRGGASRARPGEIRQRERAHLARWLRGGHRHVRAGTAQRAGELLHVGAQPAGRAEGHDEDVGRGHRCVASSRIR